MENQEEKEAFEKYCFEVFLMSPSDGHFDRELEDPEVYESVDTHRLWNLWQAKAVPEGFVLVPKELSDEKADVQALLAWGCHAGLFKSQNRDMSALQVEEFRLKWCKRKARELQEEYRVAIKAQEQGQ